MLYYSKKRKVFTMHQYILFDLDGTISDPKVGICTSVQHALEKMGINPPPIDELTPFIGPPLRDSFKQYFGIKDEEMETCISYYRERFSTVGLFENELYPGIENMLKTLHDSGKRLAIASSKPRVFVIKIMEYFHIDQYFDVMMGSELNGTRESKSEVIDECFRLLFNGDTPDLSKCVMVGDRKYDIEGAKAMHIPNIAVSYGYGSKEELTASGADEIADTVEELLELLM